MAAPTRSLAALVLAVAPAAQELGHVEFPTSARSPAAQAAFVRGVLLLHSFEYEDARDEFRAARTHEPGFAMAHWGEALSFYHPIWRREEPDQARAALRGLAPTAAERRAAAPTDLERGWLGSVEVLFGDGTRRERWTGYRDALAALHRRYPHDVEIGALYSLAILGTSFGGRDTRIYMQAAGVAQPFHRRYPDHPGLLHYLIHCYDDPIHAPLGLPMARAYDKVAPAAGHALHMPSHIYVALGMWPDSVRANVASFAAGDARRAAKQLGVEARNWHASQWLAYSHLQRGQVAAAERQLDAVARDYGDGASSTLRHHLAVMRAAHFAHTGAWDHPLAAREIEREGLRGAAIAADCFTRGMAALARGDTAGATAQLEAVRALAPRSELAPVPAAGGATCCAPSGVRPDTAQDRLALQVVAAQLEAALAWRDGPRDHALAMLRTAARLEDAMGLDFGPPAVVKPAHELLGERLLEVDRPTEAIAEFESALRRAHRRAHAMLGLARAHRAAGHTDAAARTYRALAAMWRDADADRPEVIEVR